MTKENNPPDAKDPRGADDPHPAPDSLPGSDADPARDADSVEATESAEDAFTDVERRERDRLTKKGRAKLKRGYLADIEFGQILRELRDKRLYREGGMTLEEFSIKEFDITDDSVRTYISFAELHAAFRQAGVEPLQVKSQVTALLPLPTLDDQVRAAQRGRELAEAEGTRLAARHIKEARAEIEDELLAEAETSEDPMTEVKAEVHARGGLHVVLPENALPEGVCEDEFTRPYLPGRVIAPYDELPAGESGVADRTTCDDEADADEAGAPEKLSRTDLDEVAEFVWFVLARDPWEPASAWDLPSGGFHATYYPDQLSAPSTPVKTDKARETDDRSATVLVAPGVDLLHPDVPEPVREAVVAAAGEDPKRRYLFLTEHPEQAAGVEWPANAVVCVIACDAASVEEMVHATSGIAEGAGVRFALVLRDAEGAIAAEALNNFSWVLIRGKKTSQAAYDSVFQAVPYDRVQVGRKVHARPLGYAPVVEPPVNDAPFQDVPSQDAVHDEETTPNEHAAPARDRRPVYTNGVVNDLGKATCKKPGSKKGNDRPFANLTPVGHAQGSLRATG